MSFIFTYTGRNIRWNEAAILVRSETGEIFPKVVTGTKKGSNKPILTYGFFYKDQHGSLYDVFFNQRSRLRTVATSDLLLAELAKLYPEATKFVVPLLLDVNCLKAP